MNSDGSQDMTFANPFAGAGGLRPVCDCSCDPGGRQNLCERLFERGANCQPNALPDKSNGTLDSGFTTFFVNERPSSGQSLWGVTVMPDGRVFVFGNTPLRLPGKTQRGRDQRHFFRVAHAVVSPGDFPGQPIRPYINSFGEQSDGKIVIAGRFDSVNAIAKNFAARLNTNGSVDTGYDPAFTSPE